MVTIISFGQGFISICMLLKGRIVRLAFWCYCFFMAITPLGIDSGFPVSILLSVAIYFILKKDDLDYLWNHKTKKQ
jgi:uncharacterized membrane protein YhaH (DUF805 family)